MPTWRLLPIGAFALIVGMTPASAAPAAQAPTPLVAKSDTASGVTRTSGTADTVTAMAGALVLASGSALSVELSRRKPTVRVLAITTTTTPMTVLTTIRPAMPGDPRSLCAQNFRSFEWNTGLYTTYDGDKRLCPYLR